MFLSFRLLSFSLLSLFSLSPSNQKRKIKFNKLSAHFLFFFLSFFLFFFLDRFAYVQIVCLLGTHHADFSIVNKLGRTPYDEYEAALAEDRGPTWLVVLRETLGDGTSLFFFSFFFFLEPRDPDCFILSFSSFFMYYSGGLFLLLLSFCVLFFLFFFTDIIRANYRFSQHVRNFLACPILFLLRPLTHLFSISSSD